MQTSTNRLKVSTNGLKKNLKLSNKDHNSIDQPAAPSSSTRKFNTTTSNTRSRLASMSHKSTADVCVVKREKRNKKRKTRLTRAKDAESEENV